MKASLRAMLLAAVLGGLAKSVRPPSNSDTLTIPRKRSQPHKRKMRRQRRY